RESIPLPDRQLGMATPPTSDSAAGFELICDTAEAEPPLRAWLEGMQLQWPGRFRINVKVGNTNPFGPDDREIFRQPSCTIQAGPGVDNVRLTWELAPAIAIVHPTEPEAELWLSPAALRQIADAERSFLLIVLVFILRRLGWYHVHAAALIDPMGRGWLIAGNSHCGKSTTTALLATRGWKVGTDDIGFLGWSGDRVSLMGVRGRIALRPGGAALLGAKGGLVMDRRNKEGFLPEELGSSWAPVVAPEILAFPNIGAQTAMTASSPRETLSSIVKLSHWVLYESVHAQEYLDVLGAVARQSRCFALTLGPDLFDEPDLLKDLVP
ncbi:MAG: hypothetical protein ABJB74_09550, partial [Gemmatimonas sp.]